MEKRRKKRGDGRGREKGKGGEERGTEAGDRQEHGPAVGPNQKVIVGV